MVSACLEAYGRIDVLDNNVGIAEMGNVVEVNEASWDHVFAVNLKSAYFAMKHVIPVMQKQGGGSIINISSIASIRHLGISYVTYGASKAAMNQMTKTTAVQFARDHVRVNCILPGLMKTPMVAHSAGLAASYSAGDVEAMWRARDAQVPMGHMGDAWDVAHAALFLASDEFEIHHRDRVDRRWRDYGEVELTFLVIRRERADDGGVVHPRALNSAQSSSSSSW